MLAPQPSGLKQLERHARVTCPSARTAADQDAVVLKLLAAHGVAAESQVDSMLHLIPRNLQLLQLEDVQQLIEGLQAAGASSDSI